MATFNATRVENNNVIAAQRGEFRGQGTGNSIPDGGIFSPNGTLEYFQRGTGEDVTYYVTLAGTCNGVACNVWISGLCRRPIDAQTLTYIDIPPTSLNYAVQNANLGATNESAGNATLALLRNTDGTYRKLRCNKVPYTGRAFGSGNLVTKSACIWELI